MNKNNIKFLLSTVALFVTLAYTMFFTRHHVVDRQHCLQITIKNQLEKVSEILKRFRADTGQYPSMEDGLGSLREYAPLREDPQFFDLYGEKPQNHMSWDFLLLRMSTIVGEAGVYSGWRVPFVYENRNGLPEAAFCNSPVEDDFFNHYSTNIDKGIYLYSTPAITISRDYLFYRVLNWLLILATGISAICFVRYFKRTDWAWRFCSLLAIGTVSIFQAGCYRVGALSQPDDPKFLFQQEQLLQQYEHNRAISPEAAAKIRERIRRDQARLRDIENGD